MLTISGKWEYSVENRVDRMAGHLIRRLHQISNAVFQERMKQAGFDLTSVQFAALAAIAQTPRIDQASLAAQIAYDRVTIGGVVDRLESKGLVTRTARKTDRRAREVSLTGQGEAVLQEVTPIIEALQGDILSGLSEEERQHFLQLARKAAIGAG